MKKTIYLLSVCSMMLLSGCVSRIVTYTPTVTTPVKTYTVSQPVVYQQPIQYTSTIKTVSPRTTTTNVRVSATTDDISLYLDLQAVAAAFAQSANVQEFEMLLNSSQYILNNLDLNGDGYVDYLRVVETTNGYNHVFLIQAILAANIYQDVATLVAEVPNATTAYVQVIGNTYIYGPSYIVQPVYIKTPLIITYLCRPNYKPWVSPWYWNYYPSHYKKPTPCYLSHYHAYIDVYIHEHKYCHEVTYPSQPHYTNYVNDSRSYSRSDYANAHPTTTFTSRTANIPASGNTRINNARDLQNSVRANTTTTVTSRSASATSRSASASGSTARTASSSTSSSTARTASATTSSTARKETTATSGSTSSASRTATSSSSSTAARTSTSSGKSSSSTTTSTSRPATTTSTASASSARSTSSSTTRTAASKPATPSTTVSSRVSNSGTQNTRISTRTVSGTTTTNRVSATPATRSTSSSSSSATRSASSSSSSSRSASSSTSSTRR